MAEKSSEDYQLSSHSHDRSLIQVCPHVENLDNLLDKVQRFHVLGTPLIEVLSVSIFNNKGVSSEVYGTIKVIDGQGAVFNLYNRRDEEAETITMGGALTLTIPKGAAISASDEVELFVDLKDKNQKAVIAQGSFFLDYKAINDYEEVRTKNFDGDCGYATLQYVTYQHAVVANIDVVFVRGGNDGNDVEYADVYGEIIARCGSNSITLLRKTQNQSVRVKCGTSIELSRQVVAVPAYSPLMISATLCNGDIEKQIICEEMLFYTIYWSYPVGQVRYFEGQNGYIKVRVNFSHACMHPPPERELKHKIEKDSDEESLDGRIQEKRARSNYDQQLSSSTLSLNTNSLPDQRKSSIIWTLAIEVFSVSIRSDNDEGFDVWGVIKFFDWCMGNNFFFFKRCEKCAERLLPSQPATIMAPKETLAASNLSLIVCLKDVNGREISAGHINWSEREYDTPIPWYDKQLCSVIPGDIGYAAIHYALLSDAVQARLRVYFIVENSSTVIPKVYGSIFTEYSNYRYVTRYEKEHYRSKLFHRLPEGCEELFPEFELPLAKSVVAVPRDSALIVDLDLTINTPDDKDGETFKDRLRFKTDVGSKSGQKTQGSCNSIVIVIVEWSEVSLPPRKWDDEALDIDSTFSLVN